MKKIISLLSIFVLVFIVGLMGLILVPQPLFASPYQFPHVSVYANRAIDTVAFQEAIIEAHILLTKSELYDSTYQFDLFLAHQTFYNQLDDAILGSWSIARAVDNNVIIKTEVNEKEGFVQNGPNQFDLIYVLVHEMIHCLQNHRYGMWAFNPLNHPPFWKLEGYPEYIGRRKTLDQKSYTLEKGIQTFLQLTHGIKDSHRIIQISPIESTPYVYYKGRLMIEYLMDIKGYSYDEVLEDTVKEEKVYSEMISWYKMKKAQ